MLDNYVRTYNNLGTLDTYADTYDHILCTIYNVVGIYTNKFHQRTKYNLRYACYQICCCKRKRLAVGDSYAPLTLHCLRYAR